MESHAEFLARYGQAWSAGEPGPLREMLTPDADYIEAGMGVDYIGRDRVLGFFTFMLDFSSDSLIEFTEFTHTSDGFVAEWVWSGTADGALKLGGRVLPAAGVEYSVPGVALCRLAPDGRVSYHKDIYDVYGFIKQLGYAE